MGSGLVPTRHKLECNLNVCLLRETSKLTVNTQRSQKRRRSETAPASLTYY